MELLKAIVLGVVQGLTEFLPVSSSGHLELFKFYMNNETNGGENMIMTVVLHFATALSTIIVFRKTILQLIKGLFKFEWNKETKFIIFVIVSMIPAVLVGLFFEEQLELLFDRKVPFVCIMLILTGILLFVADNAKDTGKKVTFWNSIWVGLAQAVAILPGLSRSGSTISTSVLLGLDREEAARFSFIMVLPLIFGKIAKDLLDGSFTASKDLLPELAGGFFAAFFTGLFACTLMINIVKQSKLKYFSYYCFAIAIVSLILFYTL